MKTAIITGATGGIGVAIIEACLQRDCHVVALSRKGSPNISRLNPFHQIYVVEGDLSDLEQFAASYDLPEDRVFFHLAWSHTDKIGRNDPLQQQENIQYTLEALQLAKRIGCNKFIGAGSQAEYGVHTGSKTGPDSAVFPNTAYGICKYSAGKLGSILANQIGIDFLWVRIFSVYGEHDLPETMIQSSLARMAEGEHCSFTEGTHLWDYLYSADAGEAFYLIGEKSTGNRVYCLGSGRARPLKEYICEMRDIACPGLKLGFGEIPYTNQNRFNLCADITPLQQDTGWTPKTDFGDGIRYILKSKMQG